MNLFYFYQVPDPFDALNMLDYGHHEYENYRNFLNHSPEFMEDSIKSKSDPIYSEVLKPMFKKRSQFVLFDAFDKLLSAFSHLADMKIKKPAVMGKICRKLAKHLIVAYDSNGSSKYVVGE